MADDGNGLAMVAGVPMHLAAAGLIGREVDGVAEAFEDVDDGFAGLREESVVVTGDEERHSHGGDLRELIECSFYGSNASIIQW
jgi:hypothetical protein